MAVVNGTLGPDSLVGSPLADTITGLGGADSVVADAGNDLIDGGDGDDHVHGDDGADTIIGGLGNDQMSGDAGNDSLEGGDGNDLLWGGIGSDVLNGGAGFNIAQYDSPSGINANLGAARVQHALGMDTLAFIHQINGSQFDDFLVGVDSGHATLSGAGGNDVVQGGAGNEALLGGFGNDTLNGGGGNDLLRGNQGNDQLDAGAGDDIVVGGPGNDVIGGGDGADVMIMSGPRNEYTVGANTITHNRAGETSDGTDSFSGIEGILFPNPEVYRFFHTQLGTHFYTASSAERDAVIAQFSDVYTFEGAAYYAVDEVVNPGAAPVFRFFHTQLGTHFYTASAAERDFVIANYGGTYAFEGTSWYASATPLEGDNAVYRFFHTQQGSHFYTASAAERDFVIANYSNVYAFEGAAYYVPPERGLDPFYTS
jgi:Ca2+-binding RTX toxin-like protein